MSNPADARDPATPTPLRVAPATFDPIPSVSPIAFANLPPLLIISEPSSNVPSLVVIAADGFSAASSTSSPARAGFPLKSS